MTPVARLRLDDKYPQTSELTVQFDERDGVLASRVSWSNADVLAALRQMFCLASYEHLVSIELNTVGITAWIRRDAPPPKKARMR